MKIGPLRKTLKSLPLILAFLGALLVDIGLIRLMSGKSLIPTTKELRLTPMEITALSLEDFSRRMGPEVSVKFSESSPKDAWGRTVEYQESSDGKSYELISSGADAEFGTDDDVIFSSLTGRASFKPSRSNFLVGAFYPYLVTMFLLNYLSHVVLLVPLAIFRRNAAIPHLILSLTCPLTIGCAIPVYLSIFTRAGENKKALVILYLTTAILSGWILYLSLMKN